MKSEKTIMWLTAITLGALSASGQGTFQNLDFESATLTPLPQSEWGGDVQVPISSALPDWTGYIGTTPETQVYQDTYSSGQAEINIFGPNYPAADSMPPFFNTPGVIDGNFSVLLQAGGDPQTGLTTGASIAQSGVVPAGAQSIEFKAWETPFTQFTVSLGNNTLSPIVLASGANYTLFGASIPTSLDGQFAQLQFTADFITPGSSWLGLDDITFSTQSVPEPSPFVLTAIGGLLFALYRRFAPKRP